MGYKRKGDYTGWTRASQITGKFPEDKYGFTANLKYVGDYVETYPLSERDQTRIKMAAYAWAFHHNVRVSTRIMRRPEGNCIRVTLVDRLRNRNKLYDY
jgi:hypothetical protein